MDDLPARAKNAGFAALDAHPRIEVRLYNPLGQPPRPAAQGGEFSTDFRRLNHRMHNKTWIADNRVALVGGRNLGDEYFDAHGGTNFMDLDMLMAGPVVPRPAPTSTAYWNSDSNFPIAQLSPRAISTAGLQRLRGRAGRQRRPNCGASDFAHVLREDPQVQALLAGETYLRWHSDWRFVSDDPLKKRTGHGRSIRGARVLLPPVRQAQRNLRILTPYFVPAASGTAELVAAAQRGPEVRVLTNSLAATDVAIVHGGYMRHGARCSRRACSCGNSGPGRHDRPRYGRWPSAPACIPRR